MGIGYVAGVAKNEETSVYEVKDEQGNVVFNAPDGIGEDPGPWNIVLAEGQDGRYEITLTTYPGQESNNEITWKLVEKVQPPEVTHDMYFSGTMNNWGADEEKIVKLTESGDKKTWVGFITITEDDYADWTAEQSPDKERCAALKIKNAISDKDYGVDGGMDNFFLKAGDYCFRYTVEGNKVEFKELSYYVIGTFLDDQGNQVDFSVKEGLTPEMTEDGDGNYSATFTVTDVTGSFTWIADQNKPGVMAVKVVYGCELGSRDTYAQPDGDNFYLPAGERTVKFNAATKAVTVS